MIGVTVARPRAARLHISPTLRIILLYAVTLFLIVTVIFALPRLMPGDPIQSREDPSNPLFIQDVQSRGQVLAYYGLDKPVVQQYFTYLGDLVHGNLGWSIAANQPVSTMIMQHLPWTALLMGTSIAAASLIAYVAGVAAAWRRGRLSDRALIVGTTVARSVPEYALASVLLIVFAVVFPVLPQFGGSTAFAQYSGFWDHAADIAAHLALPALSLTIGLVGVKFLLMRNTMVSVLGEDFMVLARAKGLSNHRLKHRHAGRNALLPYLTLIGIQIGFAVGGAVFIESVFAYPGMGTLILTAVNNRDYPVLEGCFLVFATAVLLMNLAIELVYRRLDPRVHGQ